MSTQNFQYHPYPVRAVARSFDVGVRGRVAFLYVDQSFKLLAINQELAEELLNLGEFNLQNGRLMLRDNIINKRLQRLVGDVLKVDDEDVMQVGGYLKVPCQGRDTLLLSVFPVKTETDSQTQRPDCQRLAEIRISYPKKTNLLIFSRAMRDLYELSASESKVVSLLVQGRNTKEIAHSLEVADSTLRTHLKRIFSKTETRHQAELVSKILQYDSYVMPDTFA